MMNFLLTSDRGKAQQNRSTHICRYCMKVFDSYQALGGHLRSHQNMMRIFPHYQSHNNSTDDTFPHCNPLLKGLGISSSGAPMNTYCVSREDHCGNETELIQSSHFSNAPNCYASSRSVTLSGALMPRALPLSRPIDNVNFNNPLGLAPHGGSTGSCQFDVEAVRRFISRYPYLSQHFLETVKGHNNSNHPPSCVICSLCPCYMMNNVLKFMGFIPRTVLDINKFLGIEDPVSAGPWSPPPLHGQLTGSMSPKEYIRALTSGRENKHCLCQDLADQVMMRALKRPRVRSGSQVSWAGIQPQNELLLFKDTDNSSSGSEISTGGEEKCETNLDLSLHL